MAAVPLHLAAVAALLLSLSSGPVWALDKPRPEPGKFDFYVLSLSWSPSFCQAAVERAPNQPGRERQCESRPYAFVVHGLWPQFEHGYPDYCQVPAPRLERNIVASMLDLMPSPRLIYHQWDRHGVCSGLSPSDYFETIRKARATVKVPPEFVELKETRTVSPQEVEEAFVKANPGLTRAGMAVTCDNRRLREVRICLSKELQFRECPEVDRRACRRDKVEMPPVRGG